MKKVKVIAEAGVNHNGSIELAKQLIDIAVAAKVDVVKFQTFKANNLATQNTPKAAYQNQTTNESESQLEMLKKYELSLEDHRLLIGYCKKKNIEFLSSAFDLESLDALVNEFNLDYIKFGSGEITNGPLLLKAAQYGKKIILSTGMSTLSDIENALAVLAYGFLNKKEPLSLRDCFDIYFSDEAKKILSNNVSLLHCTTEYPAPFDEMNLKAMDTMHAAFGLPIGFSDHTQGIFAPIAAVARGAQIIEKHFTIDKTLPGPDHKASLEPAELTKMVKMIRQIGVSIGDGKKTPSKSEVKNRDVVRKSIVAIKDIKKGEAFSEANLGLKRAKGGISGMHYWYLLGRIASQDYSKDEVIFES